MIGLALLGAGRMAKVHAEAISAAGARLVTVFDVAEAAAASLASKSGASVAQTAEEALSHPEITAVLVATSSDTHDISECSRRTAGSLPRRSRRSVSSTG